MSGLLRLLARVLACLSARMLARVPAGVHACLPACATAVLCKQRLPGKHTCKLSQRRASTRVGKRQTAHVQTDRRAHVQAAAAAKRLKDILNVYLARHYRNLLKA